MGAWEKSSSTDSFICTVAEKLHWWKIYFAAGAICLVWLIHWDSTRVINGYFIHYTYYLSSRINKQTACKVLAGHLLFLLGRQFSEWERRREISNDQMKMPICLNVYTWKTFSVYFSQTGYGFCFGACNERKSYFWAKHGNYIAWK